MGAFFKDVEEYHEAEAATGSGMYGAIGAVIWGVVTLIRLSTGENARVFPLLEPIQQFIFMALPAAEIGLGVFAAWRFRLHKGLFAGLALLLVFVADLVWQHVSGFYFGLYWYALFLGIILSLINGLRGAAALRNMNNPETVGETFE